jgi:hypothetical protein
MKAVTFSSTMTTGPDPKGLDHGTKLRLLDFDWSNLPADDEEADMALDAYEAAANALHMDLPLNANQWIVAMERRIRVRRSHIVAINGWADDRPEEAAELLAQTRREIRQAEERLTHYRAQQSLN